jgi:hypothetical protein
MLRKSINKAQNQSGRAYKQRVPALKRSGNRMRRGSVLQRRLVMLESTINVPTLEGQWAPIQAEALSNLSIEDLRILCDIFVNQAAGVAVEDTPLNH